MTYGGIRARQIAALVIVVVAVVAVSLTLEIGDVTRAAMEESVRDAQYVASSMVGHINAAVAANPRVDPYEAIRTDPNVDLSLRTAAQYAPTVLYTAFVDSAGRVVAHNDTTRLGEILPRQRPIPQVRGLAAGWRVLFAVRSDPRAYELTKTLAMGRTAFGEVRVGLSSAFIETEVNQVVKRGVMVGLLQVFVAMLAAIFLTRIFVGPLRAVRRGLEALRAGDFTYRVPRQPIDEFAGLADAINELGDQFRAREAADSGEQASLQSAVEHLADGLLVVSPDREILHVNGIAARHLGLDGPEVRGRTLRSLFPEGHPLLALADEILGGRSRHVSLRAELPHPEGRVDLLAVGHRIEDGTGTSGALIELKDLSALAELQAVMDHSATLSRLGEMAAGVAHEIRNPLNAITLHLEPLRNGGGDPESVREAVASTKAQIARLDRAVSGFLKVAKLQRLSLTRFDPVRMAGDVVSFLAPEATMAGLELKLETGDGVGEINGDPEVLRQALLNLVKNAIQALPSADGLVTVSCRRDNGKVHLAVRDTGPGIDPAELPRVFDLYMTTKKGGSGVGLAFVRQAVEMHRGSVHVDSEQGRGTVMTLRLRSDAAVEVPHA